MATQNKNLGFIIALIGSGLAILSFFTMPYLAAGLLSFTGEQIASLGVQYPNNSNSGQGLVYFWLAPAIALILFVIAALQLPGSKSLATKKIAAGWLIGLALVTFISMLGLLIYLNNQFQAQNPGSPSFVSFLSIGFWIFLLSIVAVFIGGIIELSTARIERPVIVSLVTVAVVLASSIPVYTYVNANAHTYTTVSPKQTPTIPTTPASARPVVNPAYQPVDSVYCDQLEQTSLHHHVHLTVYIDGQNISVPQGIGIAADASGPICFYWLHTHASDGIVHIEAPNQGNFTLKNFVDIWQLFAASNSQTNYPAQLSSSAGWTVYINGQQLNGDFSKVDISSNQAWHEAITIMYNSPNVKPDTNYSWQAGF